MGLFMILLMILAFSPAIIAYFIVSKLRGKLSNKLIDKEWREYTSLIEKDKGLAELLEMLQYMVGISDDAWYYSKLISATVVKVDSEAMYKEFLRAEDSDDTKRTSELILCIDKNAVTNINSMLDFVGKKWEYSADYYIKPQIIMSQISRWVDYSACDNIYARELAKYASSQIRNLRTRNELYKTLVNIIESYFAHECCTVEDKKELLEEYPDCIEYFINGKSYLMSVQVVLDKYSVKGKKTYCTNVMIDTYMFKLYADMASKNIATIAVADEENDNFKKEQRSIAAGLRFDVLRRDNYRCQICGRTAADGVELEVDHKIPVAKGGLSTMENMWTLCFDCNRGKGTKEV